MDHLDLREVLLSSFHRVGLHLVVPWADHRCFLEVDPLASPLAILRVFLTVRGREGHWVVLKDRVAAGFRRRMDSAIRMGRRGGRNVLSRGRTSRGGPHWGSRIELYSHQTRARSSSRCLARRRRKGALWKWRRAKELIVVVWYRGEAKVGWLCCKWCVPVKARGRGEG